MSTKRGRRWWNSLSIEQQQAFIAKKERNKARKRAERDNTGKVEVWSNKSGRYKKTWTSPDSYTVTRLPIVGQLTNKAEEEEMVQDMIVDEMRSRGLL